MKSALQQLGPSAIALAEAEGLFGHADGDSRQRNCDWRRRR